MNDDKRRTINEFIMEESERIRAEIPLPELLPEGILDQPQSYRYRFANLARVAEKAYDAGSLAAENSRIVETEPDNGLAFTNTEAGIVVSTIYPNSQHTVAARLTSDDLLTSQQLRKIADVMDLMKKL